MKDQKNRQEERSLDFYKEPTSQPKKGIDIKSISERGITSAVNRKKSADIKACEQIREKYEELDRETLTALVK
jgi:hypothetical protein